MTTTVRWTTAQFEQLAEVGLFNDTRIELLGGELIQMPPIGTAHMLVVTALQQRFADANAEGRLLVQQPIILGPSDEPQPDLVVLHARLNRKATPADCLLVVEVSDSTLVYDRDVKLPRYLEAGCDEVWIVDIAGRSIAIHRQDPQLNRVVSGSYPLCVATFWMLDQ